VDFNLRRFAQKAFGSKQNAESGRPYMAIQIFAGFPLSQQIEAILIFNIPEPGIA
jgi:hypothetical protein